MKANSLFGVYGQEQQRDSLRELSFRRHLSGAYLFSGPKGVGKASIARWFFALIGCEEKPKDEPCGQCPHCRKVLSDQHVDISWSAKEAGKKVIPVSEIRKKSKSFAYHSVEGGFRMWCIREAEFLNSQAQNALLKLLEEPPAHAFIVLLCEKTHHLLPTILSRCHHLRFQSLDVKEIEAILSEDPEVEAEESKIKLAARLSRGRVRFAYRWLEPESVLYRQREWSMDRWLKVLSPQRLNPSELIELAREQATLQKDLFEDAREQQRYFLELGEGICRDLVLLHHGAVDLIVQVDRFDELREISILSQSFRWEELMGTISESKVATSVNTLDRLWLQRLFLKASGWI